LLSWQRPGETGTRYKAMVKPFVSEAVLLDPEMRSSEVLDFERRLLGKIVGQDRAVSRIVNMYQIYLAGMAMPGRPIGNLLFLGPTGSGKTRIVEASAEILFGSPRAFIKIDCAEFQHSHEIAKLIGSPPGYLGHRETPPLLTPEFMNRIDKVVVFHTLTQEHLRQVLDIELSDVQNRIMASQSDRQFIFRCTAESKEFLLNEGTDLKYGARHLKRAIERHLVYPMSNLIATGQIGLGDVIKIDLAPSAAKLTFSKERATPGFAVPGSGNVMEFPSRKASQAGARLQLVETEAASCDRR